MTESDKALLRAEIAMLRAKVPNRGQAVYRPGDVGKAVARLVERTAGRNKLAVS